MLRTAALFLIGVFLLAVILYRDEIRVQVMARNYEHSPAKNELVSESFRRRILMSTGKFDPNATEGIWFNQKVTEPKDLAERILSGPTSVLGETTGEKWIEVDLSRQLLYAHEGDRIVYTFPISSGLPWFPTVTGQFHVWAKLLATEMIGGSKNDGTYYDLPNVPYVMYFYGGYAIHGTYWHHDFGKPRSHGCVNVSIENARVLFYWSNPQLAQGTSSEFNIDPSQSVRVEVHGITPTNI